MKGVVLDPSPEVQRYYSGQLITELVQPPALGMESISDYVTTIPADCELALVNVEACFQGNPRCQLKGIDLIYQLRLTGRYAFPIIAYGFLPPSMILARRPDALILFAPGNTYLQLPFDDFRLVQLCRRLSGELSHSDQIPYRYSNFVKPAFSESAFTHQTKNIWGIKRLTDTINQLRLTDKAVQYPPAVKQLLARIDTQILQLTEDTEIDDTPETAQTHQQLQAIRDAALPILYVDDQAEAGWGDLLKALLYHNAVGDDLLKVHTGAILKKQDVWVQARGRYFMPKLILLDLRLSSKDQQRVSSDVSSLRGARMLTTIRKAFPGVPVIIFSASDKIWTYQAVRNLGADGYWIKYSHARNLRKADYVHHFLKVIESIHTIATAKIFGTLSWFAGQVKTLENQKGSFWWENCEWTSMPILLPGKNTAVSNVTICEPEPVIQMLKEILELLRLYLHRDFLKMDYNPFNNQSWFYPSLILQHAGKIIEIIHNLAKLDREHSSIAVITNPVYQREDRLASLIYFQRNQASHHTLSEQLTDRDVYYNLNNLITYLNSPKGSVPYQKIIDRLDGNR